MIYVAVKKSVYRSHYQSNEHDLFIYLKSAMFSVAITSMYVRLYVIKSETWEWIDEEKV